MTNREESLAPFVLWTLSNASDKYFLLRNNVDNQDSERILLLQTLRCYRTWSHENLKKKRTI